MTRRFVHLVLLMVIWGFLQAWVLPVMIDTDRKSYFGRKIGGKIRGIFHWVARSAPYILVTCILLSVAFPFLAAGLHKPPDKPLAKAFAMAGELLLGLKSPTDAEYSQLLTGFLYAMAWIISFFGWLFIPLTIGVALDLLGQWHQRSVDFYIQAARFSSAFRKRFPLSDKQAQELEERVRRAMEELVRGSG